VTVITSWGGQHGRARGQARKDQAKGGQHGPGGEHEWGRTGPRGGTGEKGPGEGKLDGCIMH